MKPRRKGFVEQKNMAGMSRKEISVFLKSGMDMTYFIYFMDISDGILYDYFYEERGNESYGVPF